MAANFFRASARWMRGKQQQLKDRLLRVPPLQLAYRTARELSNDDATHMAAGVAYYAVLSVFPLLLGLVALFSLFLDSQTVRERLFEFVRTYLPASVDLLERNIESVARLRGILGLASILGFFWSASAVFGAIARALNRAWDVKDDRPFYIQKALHLGMGLAVGLLFLLSLGATTAIGILGRVDLRLPGGINPLDNAVIQYGSRVVTALFTLAIFLLVYRYVPNVRTPWRYIWPGALLGTLLFEVGKNLFILYLNSFANYQQVYGSLASVVILLVWTYTSAYILILGAEFTAEYARMKMGIEEGAPLTPVLSSSDD